MDDHEEKKLYRWMSRRRRNYIGGWNMRRRKYIDGPAKKIGPDRFSRFDVYWIQTNRHPSKVCI